jgi:hypothetical protein
LFVEVINSEFFFLREFSVPPQPDKDGRKKEKQKRSSAAWNATAGYSVMDADEVEAPLHVEA